MNSNYFMEKAKWCVLEGETCKAIGILEGDLYVVWFSKTLQNWKALVSTDKVKGQYWEVTHNGNKGETYVDNYIKASNMCIKDGDLIEC